MPESFYRTRSRFIIHGVIAQHLGIPARKPTPDEAKALKRAIAAARPGNWHGGWAYDCWLMERRIALKQLGIPVRGRITAIAPCPPSPGQIQIDF